MVVSESVARRFYPGEDPIGRHVYMGAPDNRVVPDSEIVGVVADVKQRGLDEERPEAVYAPHALVPGIGSVTYALRTTTDPASLGPAVRDVMRRLDPGVPLIRLQTMDDILGRALAPTRSSMLLVAVFAARRVDAGRDRRLRGAVVHGGPADAGVRHPDGARGDARRGCCGWWCSAACCRWASAPGSASAGALALSRFLRGLLYGVTPTDPATLAAVTVLLLATAASRRLPPGAAGHAGGPGAGPARVVSSTYGV